MFSSVKIVDEYYPISKDGSFSVNVENDFIFKTTHQQLWLQIELIKAGKEPLIEVWSHGQCLHRQFFRPLMSGSRLLNLSGLAIEAEQKLELKPVNCRLSPSARWVSFPELSIEPHQQVLILAPHPDDAELAAYGFYQRYASQSWIVTISPGEHLQRLNRQYVSGLDTDMAIAERRKGIIRSWNSATTPLLAGIKPERLVMLGYFNLTLKEMMQRPETQIPFPRKVEDLSPAYFRRWNQFSLTSDLNSKNQGNQLIADLTVLIEQIKPSVILVTHPELDPHPDHQATAVALGQALEQTTHQPDHVLLYANHFKDVKRFPFGPEHCGTSLPPAQLSDSIFGEWKLWSERLSMETQLDKVCALDTMHDLRHEWHLDRQLKVWWQQKWAKFPFKYYGKHPYFQTAVKSQEVFVWLSGEQYRRGIQKFCW